MKDIVVIASNTKECTNLIQVLKKKNRLLDIIDTNDNTPINIEAKHVICIGPLTKLADYLKDKNHTLKSVIIFGGFIGSNILTSKMLQKEFKGKQLIKDTNLSHDVDSSLAVLNTTPEQVKNIYMFSHNILKYVDNTLIINEILNIVSEKEDRIFMYLNINPEYNKELDMWGSGLYLLFVTGRLRTVQITTWKKDEY